MWSSGLTEYEDNALPSTPGAFYLSVIGPTASGKSNLAMLLAERLQGEIVNCDSIQLYKNFDIGSAKPSTKDQTNIRHHLIDYISWEQSFDASLFATVARKTIADVSAKHKLPIAVGGSGLYLRALWGEQFHNLPSDPNTRAQFQHRSHDDLYAELKEKDPQRAKEIHQHDIYRLTRALEIIALTGKPMSQILQEARAKQTLDNPFSCPCIILLSPERSQLHHNIALRTKFMLKNGLIDEVKSILDQGCPRESKIMQSIGYKQVGDFLAGEVRKCELEEKIIFATRQYAKRQVTWYKKVNAHITLESHPNIDEFVKKLAKYFPK